MNAPKYTPPLNPQLAQWFDALDADAKEFYQERAAIRQFDGGLNQALAERLAWIDTRNYLKRRDRPLSAQGAQDAPSTDQ